MAAWTTVANIVANLHKFYYQTANVYTNKCYIFATSNNVADFCICPNNKAIQMQIICNCKDMQYKLQMIAEKCTIY